MFTHALPYTGSSPLARGTLGLVVHAHAARRFIPARAGNTVLSRPVPQHPPVHPRSRGEHCRRYASKRITIGSSPLARGTLPRCAIHASSPRFIPARAGNTRPDYRLLALPPVHPRSRGEHSAKLMPSDSLNGSSPLARGTLRSRQRLIGLGRFIPARAGNTNTCCTCLA